jgi:hypothetical protein
VRPDSPRRCDRGEQRARHREVVEIVAAGLELGVHVRQSLLDLLVDARLLDVTAEIEGALENPLPAGRIARLIGIGELLADPLAEVVVREGLPGNAEHGELIGQQPAPPQVVQRRNELPPGEIPGCAKDHHHRRRRRTRALFERRRRPVPIVDVRRSIAIACFEHLSFLLEARRAEPLVRAWRARPARAEGVPYLSALSIAARSSGASGVTLLGKNANT